MDIKKIRFMLSKLGRDLTKLSDHRIISNDVHSKELGEYYLPFSENFGQLNRLIQKLDESGVPLNKAYIDVENFGLHYYPISIGQYGLALFQSFKKSENEQKKMQFLNIADWFMSNYLSDPTLGAYWLTTVPKPEYFVYEPWKSAFAQSRGISILLRAWQLTGQMDYFDIATRALLPFNFDIVHGGVSVDRHIGQTIYEEYVALSPTRVLDGHLFSLFGLFDYIRAVPEAIDREGLQLAKHLFYDGVDGLKAQLPSFDMGNWIRFNRCDLPHYPSYDPCSIGYMILIIGQLKILMNILKDPFFGEWANMIQEYLTLPNVIRSYYYKQKALKQLNRL